MALNFGNYENKKIELDDNNFKTFEGIQIKLNENLNEDTNTRTTIDSKQILLQSPSDAISDNQTLNTLKEPIIDTLKRDLYNIKEKIKFVLLPKSTDNYKQLYNWDLWGPLLLCLILSLLLFSSTKDQKGFVFVLVFFIFWFGGVIVTYNALFLGANMYLLYKERSLFQSMCLLGYCVFPIDLSAFIIRVFPFIPRGGKFLIAIFAFLWSSYASSLFLGQMVVPEKKLLVIYPVYLFFLFLTWFVLNSNEIL